MYIHVGVNLGSIDINSNEDIIELLTKINHPSDVSKYVKPKHKLY